MSDNEFVRRDLYEKDIDLIINELENTDKRVTDFKDSVSHQMAWTTLLIGVFQIGLALILFFLTKR